MVHQSIKVFARIRKGYKNNSEQYDIIKKKKDYEDLIFLSNFNVSNIHHGFRFHKVFNTSSHQTEIFENVAKPVICSVIEGFNGTVFAYGQTGSGKTYSINGSSKNYSDRGIIPRSIQFIFDHYSNIPEKPTIYISYMEIYNEIGYDLLSTKQQNVAKTLEELPRVFLMEDKKGDAHIRNLSVFSVTTEEEAMRLLFMGDTNRTIAETPYNEYSSRSHCIFTLYITYRSGSSKNLRSSKLHLVDLAGSERVYKSNCTGIVLHEAKSINLSLHFLQQVILALSESKRSHIPYRNSMLTHLLKDSLNGNCITTMLATLSLDKQNLQETISTCRFAQRVSLITTDPIINEITDPKQEIDLLKIRIQDLETELSRSTQFSTSATLSVQQKEKCQFEVKSFINSDKKPINVEADMTQIQFCFNLLKKEFDKRKNELKTIENLVLQKNSEIVNLTVEVNKKNEEVERLKTIIDKIPEHPVPLNSPDHNRSLTYSNRKSKELINHEDQKKFEDFKTAPESLEDLNFYKNALHNKLNLAKLYAETIEECKIKITLIRNKLINEYISSLERQDLVSELEEQQKLYKKMLLEMKQIQSETNHLEAGLKQAEIRAVYKFQTWVENNDISNQTDNDIFKENVEKLGRHLSSPSSSISNLEKLNYRKSIQEQQNNDILPLKPLVYNSKSNYLCQNQLETTDLPKHETTHFLPYCNHFKSISTIQDLPKQKLSNYKSQSVHQLYFENNCDQTTDENTFQNNLIAKEESFDLEDNISVASISDDIDTKEPLINYIEPLQDLELENAVAENKYFRESDTMDFKEFMKTVTLSGVAEIDEEIVNFYRSKLC